MEAFFKSVSRFWFSIIVYIFLAMYSLCYLYHYFSTFHRSLSVLGAVCHLDPPYKIFSTQILPLKSVTVSPQALSYTQTPNFNHPLICLHVRANFVCKHQGVLTAQARRLFSCPYAFACSSALKHVVHVPSCRCLYNFHTSALLFALASTPRLIHVLVLVSLL